MFLLDFATLVWFSLLVFVGSVIGGFVAHMLVEGYGYANMEKRLYAVERAERGTLSADVRKGKAERKQLALAEAIALHQSGVKPADIFKQLAPKYSDVALELVKDFQEGKLNL